MRHNASHVLFLSFSLSFSSSLSHCVSHRESRTNPPLPAMPLSWGQLAVGFTAAAAVAALWLLSDEDVPDNPAGQDGDGRAGPPPADNRGGGEQCNAIPVPGCLCLSPPLPVCSYPTLNLTRLCYLRLDAFLTHTAPPPLLLPVPGVLTCAAGASNAALSTRPIRSTSRQSVLDADAQGQDLPGSHPGPDRRSSSGAAVRGGDTLCRVRQLRHCFWTGFTHRSPPHRPTNAKRRMLGPTGIFTQGGPKAGNVLKRFRFSNTT